MQINQNRGTGAPKGTDALKKFLDNKYQGAEDPLEDDLHRNIQNIKKLASLGHQ